MDKLIKKILREDIHQDEKKVTEEHNKKLERIKKTLPRIIEFLKDALGEYDLYDISVGSRRIHYGSTTVYNPETGKISGFSGDVVVLKLRFIELSEGNKNVVRKKVLGYIQDIFGIQLLKYGVPFEIRFVNMEESLF